MVLWRLNGDHLHALQGAPGLRLSNSCTTELIGT